MKGIQYIRNMFLGLGILAILVTSHMAFAKENEVTSRIDAVTVYESGALVERIAKVTLSPGPNVIKVLGFPEDLDMDTLRASLKNAPGARLLDTTTTADFSAERPSTDIENLKAEIKRLKEAIAKKSNEVTVIQRKLRFMDKIIDSAAASREGVPPVNKMQNTLSFFSNTYPGVLEQDRVAQAETNILNEKLEKAKERLDIRESVLYRKQTAVTLNIIGTRKQTADVVINYMMKEAKWNPAYNLTVNPDKSKAQLVYLASVEQNTGEDWDNVQLTLLTGKPRTIGKLPELTPWRIQPFNMQSGGISGLVTDESETRLPGVTIRLNSNDGLMKTTVSDNNGHYSFLGIPAGSYDVTFSIPGFVSYKYRNVRVINGTVLEVNAVMKAAAVSEYIVVTAEPDNYVPMDKLKTVGPVTTELAVTEKHVIKNRITLLSQKYSPRDFLVLEANLDMKTDYLTIPVLDKAAYLTATLTNNSKHTFREGMVSTIFQNEFVGKSNLPYMGPGQSVVVPVAEDKAIEVKRTLSFQNHETRGFARKVQVDTYEYKIEILNRHTGTIHVVARDQVPVSADESVQVKLLQVEPAIKNTEKRDGIMEWKLEIPSGKSSEIIYRYEIIYPVGTKVNR
jgi:hypothetical protein